MTRRSVAVLIVAGIVLAAAAAPGWAQPRRDRAPVRLYIDVGYMNLFAFPKWLNLGAELELRLGPVVSINPEAAVWFRETRAGHAEFVPGATVNFRLKRFVIGGGVLRKVPAWAENASGAIVPKVQIGYIAGPTKLGLSMIYLNTTKDIVFGMTFGFGIGGRPRGPSED
jgi:hypothetical protein